jgi:hypothetical protein
MTAQALHYLNAYQEHYQKVYKFADFATDGVDTKIEVAMQKETELYLDGDFLVKLLRFAPSTDEEEEEAVATGDASGMLNDDSDSTELADEHADPDFAAQAEGRPAIIDYFVTGERIDFERARLNSADTDIKVDMKSKTIHLLEDPKSASTRAIILQFDASVKMFQNDSMRVHGARFSTEIYTRGCHWSPRQLA